MSPPEKCWVTGWVCHRNLGLANCRLHLQGGHSNKACVPLAWPGGSVLHPNAALHAPRPWALLPGHVVSKPNKSRPLQAVISSAASAARAADSALGVTRCAVPRVPASRHLNSPRLSVFPGELELGRTKNDVFPTSLHHRRCPAALVRTPRQVALHLQLLSQQQVVIGRTASEFRAQGRHDHFAPRLQLVFLTPKHAHPAARRHHAPFTIFPQRDPPR